MTGYDVTRLRPEGPTMLHHTGAIIVDGSFLILQGCDRHPDVIVPAHALVDVVRCDGSDCRGGR